MNQAIYDAAIAQGTSPRLAELLASRRVLTGMTDKQYFAKFKRLGDELGGEHLSSVVNGAKQHGYTPSESDVYFPNLAQFPGDPEAFVSPAEGRAKIEKVANKRGMVRDKGAGRSVMKFEYRQPERNPLDGPPTIAEDIVRREIRDIVRQDPEAAKEPVAKLREKVINQRLPSQGGKSMEIKPAKG
jgi:hypothetical protein